MMCDFSPLTCAYPREGVGAHDIGERVQLAHVATLALSPERVQASTHGKRRVIGVAHVAHVLATTTSPGWPCRCICGCPNRHYNVEFDLCLTCMEKARENPLVHGEKG